MNNGVIGLCDIEELIDVPIEEKFTNNYQIKVNAENEIY